MTNTIRHQGIVENIDGLHVKVKIVQTSACATCSIKGHCTSADAKEKVIDTIDAHASSYQPGDKVWVIGTLSMGVEAVVWAFILPFLVVVVSIFAFVHWWESEWMASIASLALLIPYYYILWLRKDKMKKRFSFMIQPVGN